MRILSLAVTRLLREEMGTSPGALRMSAHRIRRRYRRLLREEVGETVSRPNEVEEEVRFILSTLRANF